MVNGAPHRRRLCPGRPAIRERPHPDRSSHRRRRRPAVPARPAGVSIAAMIGMAAAVQNTLKSGTPSNKRLSRTVGMHRRSVRCPLLMIVMLAGSGFTVCGWPAWAGVGWGSPARPAGRRRDRCDRQPQARGRRAVPVLHGVVQHTSAVGIVASASSECFKRVLQASALKTKAGQHCPGQMQSTRPCQHLPAAIVIVGVLVLSAAVALPRLVTDPLVSELLCPRPATPTPNGITWKSQIAAQEALKNL